MESLPRESLLLLDLLKVIQLPCSPCMPVSDFFHHHDSYNRHLQLIATLNTCSLQLAMKTVSKVKEKLSVKAATVVDYRAGNNSTLLALMP